MTGQPLVIVLQPLYYLPVENVVLLKYISVLLLFLIDQTIFCLLTGIFNLRAWII